MKGVAPPEIRTTEIYRGAVPFVIIQLLAVAVLILFPGIALWLPEVIGW